MAIPKVRVHAFLIFQDNNTTIIDTLASLEDVVVASATGVARRNPIDHHDREVATQLALGRALQSLGRHLEQRSHGINKNREEVRAARRAAIEDEANVRALAAEIERSTLTTARPVADKHTRKTKASAKKVASA